MALFQALLGFDLPSLYWLRRRLCHTSLSVSSHPPYHVRVGSRRQGRPDTRWSRGLPAGQPYLCCLSGLTRALPLVARPAVRVALPLLLECIASRLAVPGIKGYTLRSELILHGALG